MRVFKFGGTSVGSAERMLEVARLVQDQRDGNPLVVVASAMSGVTNLLVDAGEAVAHGDRSAAAEIVDQYRLAARLICQRPVPACPLR